MESIMKLQCWPKYVVMLAVLTLIAAPFPATAQVDNANDPFAPRAAVPGEADPDSMMFREGQKFMIKFHGADKTREAIRQTTEVLRNSDNEADKEKALTELRKLLNTYFEEDMKRRQEELDEMEKRLAKLREQLDKRRTKMDEIVDLQIKVLVNEADGLGFFTSAAESNVLFERRLPYGKANAYSRRIVGPKGVTLEAPTALAPAAGPVAPIQPAPPAQPVVEQNAPR
jgi:hypothetical protein